MENSLIQTMTQEVAFDGLPAKLVTLQNKNGMSVTFMDIGATWLSCTLPIDNERREVLLGLATMSDFKKHSSYLGSTIGRYANRIAKGMFDIDGLHYQVAINQAGNTLHGGRDGFDKRRWNITHQDASTVGFSLVSADGDQGFPGNLQVSVCYQLSDENTLLISYQATTDKATPINLTNHAYFNLLGAESGLDCKSHILSINADNYLPTDGDGIPLGHPVSVQANSFDFRQAKAIASDFLKGEQQSLAKGYDHSFLLNQDSQNGACAATLCSPDKRITLKVFTNKPAIQLYTGNWLAGTPNRSGGEYMDYAGIALETQFLPDAPNHLEWAQPSPLLAPGETYRYQTAYQFTLLE
ncbi:galactose-1-epimerase [Psychromonas sp. MME2]|uniref:galactose-1-epimerase n=1 Tax=unclassified Psychromonas TaxID=2614957 RepID=UPI00339BDE0D